MRRLLPLLIIGLAVFALSACTENEDSARDSGNDGKESVETNADGNGESEEENESSENSESESNSDSQSENDSSKTISVQMMNTEGREMGKAELTQADGAVKIDFSASDIPPGTHGFHIHEKGMCEEPDFKSAGGHFNPTNVSHGTESEDGPHAGDLPNLEVSEEGSIQKELTAERVTLEEGQESSLLKEGGTALVIHAGADDQESQPSGDAVARIACGEISK
ncbi:superoxide dismutase family protein [Halobacillus halophilus]|uniref:Superoxide dismutase (Cu/Zn) n=1 Tax=Halobacillus halophilus (strain ATCC 35676 / DSM 2266 / JCM 20832 / KCTC 3685 / LMG 17431 / NBRC 102448 / NCIMB 2269) TaxID=866895 RepID=I0JIH5_HALH3|nr:superoxide dismutase family protein [Halobacillus halophilus]ASF38127.1 superoxide dismutase family protein [Halobacillus halophilus]CCG43943.1 superoxide dismutase (Cu/Zn) [Halobacillus halophilus DSM 2266]